MKMKKLLSFSLAIVMMISCVLSQAVFVSAEGATVDYNDAPYAGVYAVTADKATTITTEIGSVTELAAGETGYMYLVKGANEVDITNGAALTITDLDDNGMDYLNQVDIVNEPILDPSIDTHEPVDGAQYITIGAGESRTFTHTSHSGAGIYYPYIAGTVGATIKVIADTGFYADIYLMGGGSSGWSDANKADPELIYLRDGVQEITIINTNSYSIDLIATKFGTAGCLANADVWKDQMKVKELKVVAAADLIPEPTPTPVATPSVDYVDTFTYRADAAGVYEVTADADVVIENETGSKVALAAGETGYIYLVRGKNEIATTDASVDVTFTALENNGLDYIAEIEDTGAAIISGQEDAIYTNLGYELAPGAKYTFAYTPFAGKAGLVYPYMSFAGADATTIRVIADTGFYADIYRPAGSTNHMAWSDAAQQDLEMLYVRSGSNVITMENIGENTVTIGNIKLHSVGELKNHATWGSTLKLANLNVYNGEYESVDYGYFPEGWDGVVENHPDYNYDAEALYIDGFAPNMSSDEGMELLGTDWGYPDETGSVINKGYADAIFLPSGSYATLTLNNIPYEGTYVHSIRYGQKSFAAAALQVINTVDGVDYYTQHNLPSRGSWGKEWGYNTNCDDFIYLQEGENVITLYNAGPGGVLLYEFDIIPLVNTEDYFQHVGTVDNPEGTAPEGWQGTYAGWPDWDKTVNPWTYGVTSYINGTDIAVEYYPPYTENGMSLSDEVWVNYTVTAPEAGMYLVTAEFLGNLHLETATGDYVDFTSTGAPVQYIYLEEGDNVVTATGSAGTEFTGATFYQLTNSEEYESQRLNSTFTPEEAYDIHINPYKDMADAGTGYWYQYEWDPTEATIVQGGGSKVAYEVNVMFPGIYRVAARVGGTVGGTEGGSNYPLITIDTDGDNGYRAEIQTTHSSTPIWMQTDADGAYQYVYLKEGINRVEVTAGSSHHELWSLDFVLLTEEEQATITIDDCRLTPPRPIEINPYTDTLTEGGMGFDYHFYSTTTPPIGSGHGTQLLNGEWQRFEVTAKTAGTYQISTMAYVTGDDGVVISVETIDSKGTTNYATSAEFYKEATGGYITLKEGVNSVWVRCDGPGWVFLKGVTLTYVEDTSEILPSAFIQGWDYIGASDDVAQVPEYTVRNDYMGIHVADTTSSVADTLTYSYNVTIPADDYYGIIMTGTVPLTPIVNITLTNDADEIMMVDGELPYFGNENQSASVTITPDKVFLPAGDYVMTFTLTENEDAGTDSMLMTHVHSFEFTTLTRQDMFLAAMQSAETTEDIKAALAEFNDVLTSDITVTPETDFIYPEYAYNALLNCAMLESGAYETYEDVVTAYDFAKNMISASDDGSGNLVYTVQVGDWNEVGTTVLVAVYMENGQLYMMGEGYLEYEEAVGTYVPVEAALYDYIPEAGDQIKVFIWDNFDGLKPVF